MAKGEDSRPPGVDPKRWGELVEALDAQRRPAADDMTALHEMYLDFLAGGFTRDEALRILAYGLFHRTPLGDADEDFEE